MKCGSCELIRKYFGPETKCRKHIYEGCAEAFDGYAAKFPLIEGYRW